MYINGVFEGGGIRGIAYIGAIKFLEERGYQFKYIGGSSVGSLFASLLAAKFRAVEMEEIVANFDVNILIGSKEKKPIKKFINGIKQRGLYSMDLFEEFLNNLLATKDCTRFKNLKVGEEYLLKVVVTDLKNRKMIVIPTDLGDYKYSKDEFLIAKAVAMSCSIPIVFTPYKINDDVFIDGGVVNNFPINLFSKSEIPTLGFRLNEEVNSKNIIIKYKNKFFNFKGEPKLDSYNIVDINVAGYKITDFKKGLENYRDLIKLGYNSMRNYFYKKI